MQKFILVFLMALLTGNISAQTDSVKVIKGNYAKKKYHKQQHDEQRKQVALRDTTYNELGLCVGINSTWLRTTTPNFSNYQGRPTTQSYMHIEPHISYRIGLRWIVRRKEHSKFELGIYLNESKTYASGYLKLDYYPNRDTYNLASIRYQFTWLELPVMHYFYLDKKHLFDGAFGFQFGVPIINSSRVLGTLDYNYHGNIHELIDQKFEPRKSKLVFQIKCGFPIVRYHDSWIRMNIGAQTYLYSSVIFPDKPDLQITHNQLFLDVQIPLASWKNKIKQKKS